MGSGQQAVGKTAEGSAYAKASAGDAEGRSLVAANRNKELRTENSEL